MIFEFGITFERPPMLHENASVLGLKSLFIDYIEIGIAVFLFIMFLQKSTIAQKLITKKSG